MSVIDLTRLDGGELPPEPDPDPVSRLAVNSLADFALRINQGYSQEEVAQEELIVDRARELAPHEEQSGVYYRKVGSGAVKTMYVGTFFYGHAFPLSTI